MAAVVLVALVWLVVVGSGTFVLTLAFLGAGFFWGRSLGRRDAAGVVDRINRWHALQTQLAHIERDHDHETLHLSGWYRAERERIVRG